MEKGVGLMACDDDGYSDPYVSVNVFDLERKTNYLKQTLNPNWSEDLLFIIPFDQMKMFKDQGSVAAVKQKTETFAYGAHESYAGIDVSGSVVHGLDLPEYCKNAIIQVSCLCLTGCAIHSLCTHFSLNLCV